MSLDFLIVTITNPPAHSAVSSLKLRAVSIQQSALFFAQPSLNPSLSVPYFPTENPPPTNKYRPRPRKGVTGQTKVIPNAMRNSLDQLDMVARDPSLVEIPREVNI